jgi:hypothetical protein
MAFSAAIALMPTLKTNATMLSANTNLFIVSPPKKVFWDPSESTLGSGISTYTSPLSQKRRTPNSEGIQQDDGFGIGEKLSEESFERSVEMDGVPPAPQTPCPVKDRMTKDDQDEIFSCGVERGANARVP